MDFFERFYAMIKNEFMALFYVGVGILLLFFVASLTDGVGWITKKMYQRKEDD